MIRRAAAAGTIAWAAPVVLDSLTSPAAATTACTGPCYRFGIRAAASPTACPVNTKNLAAPPSGCQPSESCASPVEPNAVGGSYLPYYGFTYNTTLSENGCTISGSTCTGGTATTQCWVPSNSDNPSSFNVKRVFDFNLATFTSRIPLTTCASPDLFAAVAGVNDRDNVSCCGVSGYGSPFGGTATTCRPNAFDNSATLAAIAGGYRITWIFDGDNKANAGQSGTYQFTVGCSCG